MRAYRPKAWQQSSRIWSGFIRSVIISTVTEKECVCWKAAAKLSKQIGFLLCLGSHTRTHSVWLEFNEFCVYFAPMSEIAPICYCVFLSVIQYYMSQLRGFSSKVKQSRVMPRGTVHASHSRHIWSIHWSYSSSLHRTSSISYSFSWRSRFVARFTWFAFWGLWNMRWKATEPHGSLQVRTQTDLRLGWDLLEHISVIVELPPHARNSHYPTITWQMSESSKSLVTAAYSLWS